MLPNKIKRDDLSFVLSFLNEHYSGVPDVVQSLSKVTFLLSRIPKGTVVDLQLEDAFFLIHGLEVGLLYTLKKYITDSTPSSTI